MTTTNAPAPTRGARMRALLKRASGLEKIMYASIGRAITRRPAVPSGGRGFAYHRQSILVIIVFIVVSTIELVAVDLIVHRWWWLRWPLLGVGIWGLVWMVGLLCAHLMRPHTVGPVGVRIRDGMDLDVAISWDDVHSVAIRRRHFEPKSPRVIDDGDDRILAATVNDDANIRIVLEGPTTVRLPGLAPKGGEQVVTTVWLWTDEPKEYLAEVGKHL